jgi:hypothetical protein
LYEDIALASLCSQGPPSSNSARCLPNIRSILEHLVFFQVEVKLWWTTVTHSRHQLVNEVGFVVIYDPGSSEYGVGWAVVNCISMGNQTIDVHGRRQSLRIL